MEMANSSSIDVPDWSTLPAPIDDGAARHLRGMRIASAALPATDGSTIDLSTLPNTVVVYAYPRTGVPEIENPDGWDLIPGARGCTPETCSFRDHFAELKALGVGYLFGLSIQDTAANLRGKRDAAFKTSDPRDRERLIEQVFYPIFPPDRHASEVLAWLSGHPL